MNEKADPNCRWCKGTGKMTLLITTVECDCVSRLRDRKIQSKIGISDIERIWKKQLNEFPF